MTFSTPLGPILALIVPVVLIVGFAIDNWRTSRALARLGTTSALRRMSASRSNIRVFVQRVLFCAGVGGCILAAAGPSIPDHTRPEQHGIDLVVVMDYSGSMLADDMSPGRIEQMTRAVDRLLQRSVGDRIGVVVFAGDAAHFPLTHDRDAARSVYRGLSVQDLPAGSNIGQALRVARCLARSGLGSVFADPGCHTPMLKRQPSEQTQSVRERLARARAIVMFTDGEQTDGDARDELQMATRLGIEVYVVGVGTSEGARVPELDPRGYVTGWKKHPDGTPVRSHLDLTALRDLARLAGGEHRLFVLDTDTDAIPDIGRSLDKLQRGIVRQHAASRRHDVYQWFLFPGFLLLLLEACMSTRRRRVVYL